MAKKKDKDTVKAMESEYKPGWACAKGGSQVPKHCKRWPLLVGIVFLTVSVAIVGCSRSHVVEPSALHYFEQGNLALKHLKYPLAIRWFQRAIVEDDRHAEFYYNLGLAQQRAGTPELAVVAYRQAIEIDPNLPYAHHNLALVHHTLQQAQLANAHYHRYRQILGAQQSREDSRLAKHKTQSTLGQTAKVPVAKAPRKKAGLADTKGAKAALERIKKAGTRARPSKPKPRASKNPPTNLQHTSAAQTQGRKNAFGKSQPANKVRKQAYKRPQLQQAVRQHGSNPFSSAPQNQQGDVEWWNADYYQKVNP